MSWLTATVALIALVIVVLAIAGMTAITQYMTRIQQTLIQIDHLGRRVRAWKDSRLQSYVDRIPISADVMTVSRLAAVGASLWQSELQHTLLAGTLFGTAWILDLFDGLKAQAEQRRRGHPTPWGKYLDPGIDIACFLIMAIGLRDRFPTSIVCSFALLICLRVLLFGAILVARLSPRWRLRIPSTILPESIAGKFKTVFVALAFGLVIIAPHTRILVQVAIPLLVIACVLEFISLAQQGWRIKQRLRQQS